MTVAVFLDRDNTLIHNDGDLGDPNRVQLIQGAASAIASLRGLNYHIVVVTNQGGVARGQMTEEDVDLVNQRINQLVQQTSGAHIDRFYYCPYHPEGTVEDYRREHPWRKPQPGMLMQAGQDLDLDLQHCWMIGDQLRDIQAGAAAGARTILLTHDAGHVPPLRQEEEVARLVAQQGTAAPGGDEDAVPPAKPDFIARNIIEAVRIVAQQRKPEIIEQARASAQAQIKRRHVEADDEAHDEAGSPAQDERRDRGGDKDQARVPGRDADAPKPIRPKPQPAHESPGASNDEPHAESAGGFSAWPGAGSTVGEAPAATDKPAEMPAPPAQSTSSQSTASNAKMTAASNTSSTHTAADPPSSSPANSPSDPAGNSPNDLGATTGDTHRLLTEVLDELRSQRKAAASPQFSLLRTLAIALQMTALVAFVIAMTSFGNDQLFMRWAGTALIAQLATIAMLLFRRR